MANGMEQFQRMVQQFLNEHGDEFDSPMEAVDYFTRKYNEENRAGGDFTQSATTETRSMDKLDEAMSTDSFKRSRKLLKEAVELWPENWDAQSMLIDSDPDIDMFQLVDHYKYLEKRAHKDWQKNTDRVGYRNVEERPYLRLKGKLAFLFMDIGMVDHALEHLLELYKIDESDALGTRYKIMALYVRKFDWKSAWRFYQKAEGADEDDQLLLPIIILAVLTDRQDLAKSLLEKLVEVNPEIGMVFIDDMWPIEELYDDEITSAPSFQPFSYQSLLMALRDILYVIIENEYLFKWLKRETFKLLPEDQKNEIMHQPFYGEIDPYGSLELGNFFESLSEDSSNPLRGIKIDRVRILYQAGLITFEDFAEVSEKDVLGLDGIGPVTIKELKANGVAFRK
ncbi:tetratricopeptide repeat protein [Alkalibacterium putridalgicola]|uniref:tetratricopeptide repeat protein n=1 Tax=Alkalibacterium putridalgicola TaxID=426703 RepID=UPI0034CF48C8